TAGRIAGDDFAADLGPAHLDVLQLHAGILEELFEFTVFEGNAGRVAMHHPGDPTVDQHDDENKEETVAQPGKAALFAPFFHRPNLPCYKMSIPVFGAKRQRLGSPRILSTLREGGSAVNSLRGCGGLPIGRAGSVSDRSLPVLRSLTLPAR